MIFKPVVKSLYTKDSTTKLNRNEFELIMQQLIENSKTYEPKKHWQKIHLLERLLCITHQNQNKNDYQSTFQ